MIVLHFQVVSGMFAEICTILPYMGITLRCRVKPMADLASSLRHGQIPTSRCPTMYLMGTNNISTFERNQTKTLGGDAFPMPWVRKRQIIKKEKEF